MKRIGIYFFCVIAIGCVTSSILYWKKEGPGKITVEKSSEEETAYVETDTQISESVIKVEEGSGRLAAFFIIEEDGYLVIYNQITGERFDNTSIHARDLPMRLQNDLEDGLYFESEQELYEFLENYSS